jgi:hypothetical protein
VAPAKVSVSPRSIQVDSATPIKVDLSMPRTASKLASSKVAVGYFSWAR